MYSYFYKNILFPVYDGLIRRRKTFGYRKFLDESQWWSLDQLKQFQWNELQQLLDHAYHNVDYYRGIFQAHGLKPEDICKEEDFHMLPLLTKEIIRDNKDRLIASSFRGKVIFKSTGGSTGVPLHLAHDKNSYDWRMATAMRGYSWAQAEEGRHVIYVWGAPIGKRSKVQVAKESLHQMVLNKKVFNSFEFSEPRMQEVLNYINFYQPNAMVGYTSAVYNLARWIKEKHLKCAKIAHIVTAAEKVFPHQRELIEEVFRGEVFNSYGCREFMLIAMECPAHEGLHVQMENVLVEVLKDGRPAQAGEVGEIVVTDLHNYGMPFIRYRVGDLAVVSDKKCSCGRNLPLLQDVSGRLLDTIQTVDGRIVPGEYFPHLIKEFEEIKQFQVTQKTKESVVLRIIEAKPLSAARKDILRQELVKVLGSKIIIDIQIVNDIPLTASGKFRVTVSELPVSWGN